MKHDLYGWRGVFSFTLTQQLKSRAFIVSSCISIGLLIVMTLGINFIIPVVMNNSSKDSASDSGESEKAETKNSDVTAYYIIDGSLSDYADYIMTSADLKGTLLSASELDSITAQVKDSTDELLIHIYADPLGYNAVVSRPEDTSVISEDFARNTSTVISSVAKDAIFLSLGISEDSLSEAYKNVTGRYTVAGEEPTSDIANMISQLLPSLVSIVLFMFIYVYGAMVAQSVATEKTSRVMELLLTSIRPLAVVVGKVLAICLTALIQVVGIFAVTSLTAAASAPFGILGQLTGAVPVDDPEIQFVSSELAKSFSGFNPASILLIVIIFILGFFLYALMAGLVGASISRIEDLQTAMQPFAFMGIFGLYLAYLPALFTGLSPDGVNNFVTASRIIPLSSPFALPTAIILGQISGFMAALSIAILAVSVGFLAYIVANVYEGIVLHTGDRITFKKMIKLAFTHN